ncbi:MAG TPA: ATP-binding protein [Rhodothermales bacterium]|nr:ATP-binding protein [Rhodothermales bacterium]
MPSARAAAAAAAPTAAPSLFDQPPTPDAHFRAHFFWAARELAAFVEALAPPSFLERHGFLSAYAAEADAQLAVGADWAAAVTRWERRSREELPLRAMGRTLGLGPRARLPILLAGLVEEDVRFGTLFSDLQAPLPYRRPTLELIGRVLGGGLDEAEPYRVVRPLLDGGYLAAENPTAPRAEWALRVPDPLWAALRAEPPQAGSGCTLHPASSFPTVAELVAEPALLRRLARAVPMLQAGRVPALVVRGPEGADRLTLVGAVARALGRDVLAADGEAPATAALPLGALCTLLSAMPVLRYDLTPGQSAEVPVLKGYSGPLGIVTGLEGGLKGDSIEGAVTVPLAPLAAAERRRYWEGTLGPAAGPDLDVIVERYHLPGGHIRRIAGAARAAAALDGRPHVELGDVRDARRTLGRELLDTLAERLDSGVAEGDPWAYLVAGASVRDRLDELERRCRHRERLLAHLGPAFGTGTGRGVRALFTGPSGTGKTLATRLLAARLGMDLYRVDLAAVVNKYIGETEKNLHRVLSAAEDLDVLLLLDEGDALLGSRTDVKSSNDRYANLETNYLLQRLEHYGGVVVVTTNLGENIDRGFQRRMDLVVDFFPPQSDERHRLWQLHLPARHRVEAPFLDAVASQCALTGGQIRNAAHLATLLALDDGSPAVTSAHLEAALRGEYRKAGATYPRDGAAPTGARARATHAFLDALTR